MQRPELPRRWRLGMLSPLLITGPLLADRAGLPPELEWFFLGCILLAPLVAGALLVSLARSSRQGMVAALLGLAAAIAYGWNRSAGVGFLMALALVSPAAIGVARWHSLLSPLLVGGAAATIAANAMFWRTEGLTSDPNVELLGNLGVLALILGYAGYLLGSRPDPADRALPAWNLFAIVTTGALLFVVSFAIGGHLLFLPLWPLALFLVALPALARWRVHMVAAALVGALILAGIVPIATCTKSSSSDAIYPDGPPDGVYRSSQRVTLMELAGNGPRWSSSDGFSGASFACPGWATALGAGWGLLLVGSAIAAVRRQPHDFASTSASLAARRP